MIIHSSARLNNEFSHNGDAQTVNAKHNGIRLKRVVHLLESLYKASHHTQPPEITQHHLDLLQVK